MRILLQFDNEEEFRKVYDILSADGKVDFQLQKAFKGDKVNPTINDIGFL